MNTLNLTFESLRGDEGRRRRGEHQRVASDATGVMLMTPAGWTSGDGGDNDSSNALVLDPQQRKQILKDHEGATPEEDEREGQTLWGYCCCCCLALAVLIAVPGAIAAWDASRSPERPLRSPPVAPTSVVSTRRAPR